MIAEILEVEDWKHVLVEAATKKPVTVLEGFPGAQNAPYPPVAIWSADSTLLRWKVEGKWFEITHLLLKLKDGKVAWQLNLRKAVESAILKRTKEGSPDTYQMKKAASAGKGSAYPDGFAVFITLADEKELKLPLKVHVSLTSNQKMSRLPDNDWKSHPSNLESELDGVVDESGRFTVTRFKLLQKGGPYPRPD